MSYQEERLQEIADAIREVKGTTEKIPATNFASEIVGLSVVKPSGIKTITENGDYDVSNYAWASVNVETALRERDILGKWVDEGSGGTLVYEFKENGIFLFNGFEGTYTILGNTIQARMIIEMPNMEPQTITFIFTYNRDADTLVRVGDDGLEYVSTRVPVIAGLPIEATTDTDMTNALVEDNLGKVYKFTGTSDTYETDAIYIVSEVE
jgi:hypothetical protein